MMARLSIDGIGAVGGFGCGVEALRRALRKGHQSAEEEVAGSPLLADTAPLSEFVAKRAVRRLDHFSKMALLGAHLALRDAGLPAPVPERTAVVVATGYGPTRTTFAFLDSVIDDGDACASPTHFSNSVHNAAAAHVAIQLQATGPSLTVSQFEMSVPSALLSAGAWLAEGRVDRVLFGAVDEYCEVLRYCRERFAAEGGEFGIGPGALPAGEGAAFFLLSRAGEGGGRYGAIEEVRLGRIPDAPIESGTDLLLLGADGQQCCDAGYRNLVPAGAPALCHAPLYGCLPVGPAFDLAAAALTLEQGQAFPAPGVPEDLPVSRVRCLKAGPAGEYGAIVLGRDAGERSEQC
ncbi:MAG: beta-ketoacyl synthase [Desulfuromonas sp.]|uniref:beta-ketoacyl synthase chain length factor n=1 Tax=Desulfuromonas sp. TaxID=892 RepID=UPI000CC18287|nr:beta-ketoacyl synthase chain length factor [Desulfuromonas sp.]PLX85234.1 MAG: beta-ketoacyl synthase [Desulfuromonas sp.]